MNELNEFFEKANERIAKIATVYKKTIRFAKRQPYLTACIGIILLGLLIGIILLFRVYGGLILTGLLMFWLSLPPKQHPFVPSGSTVAYIIFLATIDLHKPLLIRRPKVQREINEKHIDTGRLECYLVKEHPNAPIDNEILDDGRFLLQDKVRHVGANYGCIPTIEAVADEGGFVKITVSWGDGAKVVKVAPKPPKTPETVTTHNDADFNEENIEEKLVNKNNQTGVSVAYNRDLYEQGVISALMWNPQTHPMMLVIGTTGSGKTYKLRVDLGKIVKYLPDAELTICDFKNEDFRNFEGLPRHYGYMDCTQGLADFYAAFQRRLDKSDTSTNPRILLFDEWGAYVTSLERKAADHARATLSTIAFLGRSYNTHLIIGLQRADASHFASGARDQFSAILAFGNLSKEQKGMLFSEYKDDMVADCGRGTGYFLRDGKGIKRCVVLPVRDMDKLNATIAKGLSADFSNSNGASCDDPENFRR